MTTDAGSPPPTTALAAPGAWVRPPRQFLRPTSRRYVFDELCSRLVDALERRGFHVPGVRVEFHDYGSGDQRLRYLSLVEAEGVRIVFGRQQGTIEGGYWYDTAAVSEIWVPRVYVHAWEDSLKGCVYEGSGWEQDRAEFWERHVWPDDARYVQRRRCLPQGAASEVQRYLGQVFLPLVEACPVSTSVDSLSPESEPAPLPVPAWLREVYCWASQGDAVRVETGRRDPREVVPWKRYGMLPGGYRLVPIGGSDGSSLPALAYDSFLWCGTRPPALRAPRPGRRWRDERVCDLVVPGHDPGSSDCVVLVVRPRSAHEIYVADQAVWDRRRAELARSDPRRDTGQEIRDFTSARARTLVPVAEYRGGYEDPIVLVHRDLEFDEVEVFPGQDALLEGWR